MESLAVLVEGLRQCGATQSARGDAGLGHNKRLATVT